MAGDVCGAFGNSFVNGGCRLLVAGVCKSFVDGVRELLVVIGVRDSGEKLSFRRGSKSSDLITSRSPLLSLWSRIGVTSFDSSSKSSDLKALTSSFPLGSPSSSSSTDCRAIRLLI